MFHFESVSSDNEFGFVIIYIADIVRIPKANILNILSKLVLLFIMLFFIKSEFINGRFVNKKGDILKLPQISPLIYFIML